MIQTETNNDVHFGYFTERRNFNYWLYHFFHISFLPQNKNNEILLLVQKHIFLNPADFLLFISLRS